MEMKRREEKRREEDLIEYRGVKEFKPDQYIKIMFRNFIIQFPNFIQVTRMCILPRIHHWEVKDYTFVGLCDSGGRVGKKQKLKKISKF